MTRFSVPQISGAIAAGVMILALAAPAQASTVTFNFDYTAASLQGTTVVKSLVNTTYEGTVLAGNGNTYGEYLLDSIVGTRVTTDGSTVVTYNISGLSTPPGDANFTFDNLILLNTATGLAALDDNGIAFFAGNATNSAEYNVFYNDVFPAAYFNQYVESSSTNNDAVVQLVISQVPTPTALALIGASLLGMGFVRRRKNV
jgi:hypothetical protein